MLSTASACCWLCMYRESVLLAVHVQRKLAVGCACTSSACCWLCTLYRECVLMAVQVCMYRESVLLAVHMYRECVLLAVHVPRVRAAYTQCFSQYYYLVNKRRASYFLLSAGIFFISINYECIQHISMRRLSE